MSISQEPTLLSRIFPTPLSIFGGFKECLELDAMQGLQLGKLCLHCVAQESSSFLLSRLQLVPKPQLHGHCS